MKLSQKLMLLLNTAVTVCVFVLNYIYQSTGFDFSLKFLCSALFAVLGLFNFIYAAREKQCDVKFYARMFAALAFAFLGDIFIMVDFVVGAATFALAHVLFAAAYYRVRTFKLSDLLIGGLFFVSAASFLLLSPILSFDEPAFLAVCLVYALIISAMLGKALGNFIAERTLFTGTVALASFLFFFSDLMLVLGWFGGLGSWTNNACMGTYYPALCFLAFSMCIRSVKTPK